MDVYGKSVATIIESADADFGPNGGFIAILSTPSKDRDGDRLARKEWIEPLADRYPLDIDHGMSVADTVGSFHPYWEDDDLLMKALFASTAKAQEVRALVTPDENGVRHINSVSVAFMTDKSKKSGEPRRELLNAGIVAVPSNRDAVILASKAANALKDAVSMGAEGDMSDEVKAVILEALSADSKAAQPHASGMGGDKALLQAAHDAMVHLGAVCFPLQSETADPTGSSDGANKTGFDVNRVLVKWGDQSQIFTEEEFHDGTASTWLKSFIEEDNTVEVKSQLLSIEIPDGVDLEKFKTDLTMILQPTEAPAEVPAVEAAAASEEVTEVATEEPAPAEAATDAATEVDPDRRARDMAMALFATNFN